MYTKNEDGTLTLDTGDVVELQLTHELLSTGDVVYKARAQSGEVVVEYHHTCPSIDENLAKQILLLVLGEPSEMNVSEELKKSVNIRHHLAAAQAPQPDLMSLL